MFSSARTRMLGVCLSILMSLLLLSGCATLGFESVEEQQQREEDAAQLAQNKEDVDPADMQQGAAHISNTLQNSVGAVLATYEVTAPQFDESGNKSTVFARINEYYAQELATYEQDCQGFFEYVKQSYGEEWDTAAVQGAPYSVTFSFALVPSDADYISIESTYLMRDNQGVEQSYTGADVFFATNGWKADFVDLVDSTRLSEVYARTLAQVEAWCVLEGVVYTPSEALTGEALTEHFSIRGDQLVLLVEPFVLSTEDAVSREIAIDLSHYKDYLVAQAS